jgi:hypothetical protein
MSFFKAKILIILGMHRSGTSVLSGCLNLLGGYLGKNLMPGGECQKSCHLSFVFKKREKNLRFLKIKY